MNYKIIYQEDGVTPSLIFEPTLGYIPLDEANSDYQQYLLWVFENGDASNGAEV